METAEPITIYAVGCKGKSQVSYGAYLKLDDVIMESSSLLGDFTQNQVSLISVIMALRCVKPDYRDRPVVLCVSGGYAMRVLARGVAGWLMSPTANPDVVKEVRQTIELFPNIEIRKQPQDEFRHRCIQMAKACLTDD